MKVSFIIKHKEVVVGAFVLIAGFIFIGLIALTMMSQDLFEEYYRLEAVYSSGTGLNRGAPVCIAGMTIGSIESVELNDRGSVTIMLRIKKAEQQRIRANSVAYIRRVNPAVGDKIVNITSGSLDHRSLQDGEVIKSVDPVDLEDALVHLAVIVADVEKIVKKIERGEGTVGALLNDTTMLKKVNRLLISGNRMVNGGNAVLSQLDGISKKTNDVVDGVPQIMDKTGNVLGTVETLTQRADTLILLLTEVLKQTLPLISMGREEIIDVSDLLDAVKNNWFLQWGAEDPVPDQIIYEETRK